MKIGRIGLLAFTLGVAGGFAEAALPKPVSMIDKVATSVSRGAYGFRTTRYNKPTWGNRGPQTMGRVPVVLSPYVRS
jgi:hypothetical protein